MDYYELKEKGLCTKCKKPLGESPSSVRCKSCNDKRNARRNTLNRDKPKNTHNKCSNCGEISSNYYCDKCEAKISLSRNTSLSLESDTCINCNAPSSDRICPRCIRVVTINKLNALMRYKTECSVCGLREASLLRIVSSDLSKALKFKNEALYKHICKKRIPPKEYEVMCHQCYQATCVNYVKSNFLNNDSDIKSLPNTL